jgi:hypothetical protein
LRALVLIKQTVFPQSEDDPFVDPYAHWLSHPGRFLNAGILPKAIENRDWTTKYRGPLLIHASVTFEHDAIDCWVGRCPELEHVIPLDERAYAKGALVGIAELVDVVHQSTDPWFIGPYGFCWQMRARWSRSPIAGS